MAEFIPHSLENLLSPMILFFVLGWIAVMTNAKVELPEGMVRAMSTYLVASIGLKGGIEIAHEGWGVPVVRACLARILLGLLLPIIAFGMLRWLGGFSSFESAAIAAHYGSVSAVTFLTAATFLTRQGFTYEGYTIAMMAVVEESQRSIPF